MSEMELRTEDRELLENFAGDLTIMQSMIGPRIEKLESDMRVVKQRSWKPNFGGAANGDEGGTLAVVDRFALASNKDLNAWVAAPKTKQSAVALEIPFRTKSRSLQTKATISGVGIAVPAGAGLVGPELVHMLAPSGAGGHRQATAEPRELVE